jgi:hypothetical protein
LEKNEEEMKFFLGGLWWRKSLRLCGIVLQQFGIVTLLFFSTTFVSWRKPLFIARMEA